MDNQEINERIAREVMGWSLPHEVYEDWDGMPDSWLKPEPKNRTGYEWVGFWSQEPPIGLWDLWRCTGSEVWNPCERWDHAGMVLDRLAELGFVVSIRADGLRSPNVERYTFFAGGVMRYDAATGPLAISIGALNLLEYARLANRMPRVIFPLEAKADE